MKHQLLSAAVVFALTGTSVFAQGTRVDYERANSLKAATRGKVFGSTIEPTWVHESTFWYQVERGRNSNEFIWVDAKASTRRPAFDHEGLATALAAETKESIDAKNLPIRNVEISTDELTFQFHGRSWMWKREENVLSWEAEVDAPHEKTLTSLTEVQRSRGHGEETWIQFINKTGSPIKLFWIDSRGKRHPYATVAAGNMHEQHTFGGHIWLATESDDNKPLAVFRADNQRRKAVIDGMVAIRQTKRAGPKKTAVEPRHDSPNGRWSVAVRDDNIVLRTKATGEETILSKAGHPDDPFVNRFVWSPDSKRLIAIQQSLGEKREVHLIESSPQDQLQPKLHTTAYAKPGDKLPVARPRLFDVEGKLRVPISEELFSNAWRISDIRWQPNSRRFTFLYNQRGHQVLRIIVVDAETGECAAMVDEQSNTFIDYAYKRYAKFLDRSHELIWMSERDGWNHLYLYDTRTGEVIRQITQGNWVLRGVDRVDEQARRIWFRASGVYPEQDPYFVHFGSVDFNGENLTWLSEGNGTHSVDYSPNGDYFIDTFSRVDLAPVHELRRSIDGTLVCELERADWTPLLDTGWHPPRRFAAKGRDGKTDIHGVLYLPTNFDTEKKYPVIEKIYAGPHGSFVPKSFAGYRKEQSYAELGFIVVQIDGMGTSNRSKAFHDVAWKNLGDSGFPDRILWMRAIAKQLPQMDLSRVGIFGGSAGGQSALRALLAFGDFYKVAVADCGCHDNRMDKVWWNELWMGWPLGPHYEEQSNVTQASRLTGKLLLTVGELDRNVDPASTMQVVNALIQADKDFDLLIVPGAGHGIGESAYANRRRQDFFVRHLWGKEPRR